MKAKQVIVVAMVALASLGNGVMAQARNEKETPQKVETPIKVKQTAEWYKTQERLWRAEIEGTRRMKRHGKTIAMRYAIEVGMRVSPTSTNVSMPS